MSETTKELERLVSAANPQGCICGEADDGGRKDCLSCCADLKLQEVALPLAAEVLARRKWETQARPALEELTFVFEDVRQYPLRISQKVTERLAAVGRDALAPLEVSDGE